LRGKWCIVDWRAIEVIEMKLKCAIVGTKTEGQAKKKRKSR
jgi:hypothetical protein